MADVTQSAAEIVNEKWDRSKEYADEALELVEEDKEALRNDIMAPPTISARFDILPAPSLPPIPEVPNTPDIALIVPDRMPGPLTAEMLDVPIDDFNAVAPTVNYGQAPTLNIGQAPAIPEVRDVAIPDAPVVDMPAAPEFLALTTYPAPSINLREEWMEKLKDIPELTIVEPTPFTYTQGAKYASDLLDLLKATLKARVSGGTGLNPQVEAQLWGRELDRETAAAQARAQEVLRSNEALGFPLPGGIIAGQLFDSARQKFDQLATRSREISIEQARLEQQNLQNTIASITQLETVLMDDAYKMEQLAFQSAKEHADNSIALNNARIAAYQALLEGYRTYASIYDTLIKAELSKVTLFEALLKAEQTKADINQSLVARYRAEIEGRMAVVEVFKARVSAAQTMLEVERTRIQAGAEQVRAFVATINGETAKAELYKITLEGEQTKMQVFAEQVKAYSAKVGAQSERARAQVAKYQAEISAKDLEWRGWTARLSAASAVVDATAKQSAVITDAYRIGVHAAESQAQSVMFRWQADIRQYEAATNLAFTQQKYNADAIQHSQDARREANKLSLAASSQQLASAWTAVSADARISGQATLNQTISS